MSVPVNQLDYERFKKLAEVIMSSGVGEISIYTSHDKNPKGCYVSIEMKSSHVNSEHLEEIFKCGPLPEAPPPVIRDNSYD